MGLTNYLLANQQGDIKKGDVVFHIADPSATGWTRRHLAHVGLARTERQGHKLNGLVPVYHMTLQKVVRDDWDSGTDRGHSCVNLVGTHENLSIQKRAKIVDTALKYYSLRKSKVVEQVLYYFGDPSVTGHPVHGRAKDLYAFTCASFVQECYREANRPIVDMAHMPDVTDAERRDFAEFLRRCCSLPNSADYVQDTAFKRLHPAYLAHAFQLATYPLDRVDWENLQDHAAFIPTPSVIGSLPAPPEQTGTVGKPSAESSNPEPTPGEQSGT